jgi:hypothetical protein
MSKFRRPFAFSVLTMLIAASLFLSSCTSEDAKQQPTTDADVQTSQLIDQARAELQTAEDLFETGTCDSRRRATETLLKVDMLIEQITNLDSDEARSIASLADDKYHQYIRDGYAAECCWAVNLIIRCAEDHLHTLEAPQMATLEGIKTRYHRRCETPSKGPIQTAMLMR